MIRFDHYQSGAIYGIRYQFEKAGEEIPEHIHGPIHAGRHNIIVLKGTVALEAEGKGEVLPAGEVFDFDGSIPHKIVALEPAVILNLFLEGKPPQWGPETETSGVM